MPFEVFEHTADLGLRVRSDSREGLFADAGRALFSVIVANLDAVRPLQERVIVVEATAAEDRDEMWLFDWLSELLFIFETERLLLSQFQIQFERNRLSVVARGEPMAFDRHEMDHEVKAITYHDLRLEQTGSAWEAEFIVDI